MKPVILENEYLRVSVLPERGGKIASLYDRRRKSEWLFRREPGVGSGEASGFGTDDAPFTVPDAFGFDEMFPTILPFRWTDGRGTIHSEPDHGRVWRYGWNVLLQEKDELDLELRQEVAGWFFRRRLRLRDNRLEFFYRAGNLSSHSMPALWTPHPLFSFFPETEIILPPSLRTIRRAMDGGRFGRHGETAELKSIGLPLLQPALLPIGSAFKFYNAEPPEESIYSIHDRRGTLTLDCRGGQLPWIGFWINNGGWGGQRNIALEPASAPMDSPEQSEAYGVPAYLAAGEIREWSMVFKVEE
jgi:galactose mutarotase-like enzyme